VIAEVQKKGAVMIDKEPRGGAGGMDIAFVHPKSVGICGVLRPA
jgi:methylmalonyl-CoA/ethylmalonyl-CoA epimerase